MKSPQAVFDELCIFIFEKMHVLNFSKKGRTKFVRKCAVGTACVNIKKSVATTKEKIKFTIELNIFIDALDWINRNPENYWQRNQPDIQFWFYKFSPNSSQTDDWWEISNEVDGQSFIDQISIDLLENFKKYVSTFESMDATLNLWLSYVDSKNSSPMRKIEYAGLLYGFNKKTEGERFLERLLPSIKDDRERKLVVRYVEKFSKRFY